MSALPHFSASARQAEQDAGEETAPDWIVGVLELLFIKRFPFLAGLAHAKARRREGGGGSEGDDFGFYGGEAGGELFVHGSQVLDDFQGVDDGAVIPAAYDPANLLGGEFQVLTQDVHADLPGFHDCRASIFAEDVPDEDSIILGHVADDRRGRHADAQVIAFESQVYCLGICFWRSRELDLDGLSWRRGRKGAD